MKLKLNHPKNRPAGRRRFKLAVCSSLALLFFTLDGITQTPEWIWQDTRAAKAQEVCFFRKEFNVGFKPLMAEIKATGDDETVVYLNGREVAQSKDWRQPVTVDVTASVREGKNLLAVRGRNLSAGAAAMLVKLEVRSPNNFGLFIVTDKTWSQSSQETKGWETTEFAAANWKPAVSLGQLGVAPWGNALGAPQATPAESLTVLPGFKAELLKSADRGEGSWICMAVDHQGRLIISPEKDEAPLLRLTLGADGQVTKTEKIPAPVRAAMGLLYAHDSLYLNGHGPKGVGLYRLIDANHNDQFDTNEVHLLKNFDGDSEHGYHAVALGPDKMIYVMNGNFTKVPPGLAPDSPHQNYAEDLLLPRLWDPNGHAKGILSPGGHVLKTDPEGQRWEMFCGGFRNAYDFDFNAAGELFTFDSDMEWDVGAPWYRPTRINHCVNGGEYGWRSGTGVWPAHYPDSLPSNLNIGLSSPTGVRFGTKSSFPPKYRDALFACDWNYGKIFAVHLQPQGASYTGTFEEFVSGKPLAVTSCVFGQDGAMYFIIGGWKMQSGLYRISYVGPKVPEPEISAVVAAERKAAEDQRAIRHRLEAFHGKKNPAAIDVAWPYLDSPDRWLRFAARVAVESQEVALWQQRALDETRVDASLNALLALARKGDKAAQPPLFASLGRLAKRELTEAQELDALRVLQLCLVRMGRPEKETADKIIAELSQLYPAKSENLNRELAQLLVYLDAPDAVTRTLALMAAAPMQEEQMHYAHVLRNTKSGWSGEQRRVYFSWFNRALRDYKGGNSFDKYLVNIRQEAVASLNEKERAEVASIIENRSAQSQPEVAPRAFVKEWSMDLLEPALADAGHRRSYQRGKEAFAAAQCVVCHRMGNDGGAVGPDLTAVAARFNRRDLLENMVLPSKVISDRYQTLIITKRDGEDVSGVITEETGDKLILMVNAVTQQRETILKKDIQTSAVSLLSAMPEGLLNTLTREEIMDLVAFLEAGGRADAAVFAQKK